MADVGLEAVDRQDHPPGRRRQAADAGGVGQGHGQQLVVAVQEVADAADADGDAAAGELGVDLRDAAMLGVAERADHGDDVEAELVLRQGEAALLLGPQRGPIPRADSVAASPHLDGQADRPVEGDDDPVALVGGPERPAAHRAGAGVGGQLDLAIRLRPAGESGHPCTSRGVSSPQEYPIPVHRSSRLCHASFLPPPQNLWVEKALFRAAFPRLFKEIRAARGRRFS